MSPSEIYKLPVTRVERGLWNLEAHFPECSSDCFHDPVPGLETRIFHSENFDGERYWELAGVYLNDQPFMIIQNAGRGGQDHEARFITDLPLFLKAVQLIRNQTPPSQEDIVALDQDLDELTQFYGHSLSEFHDPNMSPPKHKVGDIVVASVLENHLNASNKKIATRVKIQRVYPTHPTKTYYGVQLDRGWEKGGFTKMIDVEPGTGYIGAQFCEADILSLCTTT